jgi:hypothetical protein
VAPYFHVWCVSSFLSLSAIELFACMPYGLDPINDLATAPADGCSITKAYATHFTISGAFDVSAEHAYAQEEITSC